ncbi:MAG: hypothetical protein JOY99_06670 [Sphingomonadaceae bacterium]|nr:hypothetical protein [Sphingomonadaceae bacterium]
MATTDQTEADAQALRIVKRPEVQHARSNVEMRWRRVLHNDPPEEAWLSFQDMLTDYTYNYALKSVADPNYPRVIHIYTQPHKWRGMDVPGSRWGGNNPDNVYRIIPIDGKAHYRLDGQRIGSGPDDVSYQLVGDYQTTQTLGLLGGRDLVYKPDGSFSITLDPEPANGRPNHIQTKPTALFLFIRDSLGDWAEKANALSIHRLDSPDAPPRTDEQAAAIAADAMVNGQAQVYYYVKMAHGTPNYLEPFPNSSGSGGGLLTQRASIGDAMLGDDEALVITLQPGGAQYYSLVAHDYWFITRDVTRYLSSLANGQSQPNRDGTITYVMSLKDPGIHNWIDPGGLHNSIMMIRLQGLPAHPTVEPTVQSRLIKLSELKAVLPPDTKWVTPRERAAQLAQRKAQYEARLADR